VIDCPLCDAPLPVLKPSANLVRNERKAGLWCPHCRVAWRALLYPDEGWRATNDIGVGPVRWWVLNGHANGATAD